MILGTSLPLSALLALAPLAGDPATNDARLDAALDAISAESIQADIEFVAGDLLGGRDTPSPGLRATARYIRHTLQQYGFRPGARDGWFHEWPVLLRRMDDESSLVWRVDGVTHPLAFGRDYWLHSDKELRDVDARGMLVACGEGDRDDFDAVDVDGRWALCADSGGSLLKRRNEAVRAGAVGMLVYPAEGYDGTAYGRRFKDALEACRRGYAIHASERPSDREHFPQAYLSAEVGRELAERLAAGEAIEVEEQRRAERIAQVENVCGFWPGSDPELADETLVISAHYDHVGYQGGELHPGADDNGSGTCGLLAIAEALNTYGSFPRSVLLIWVSGEEKGLWGSAAWADEPWLPDGARAVCNINIDMIGRNDPSELLYTPTRRLREYNGLAGLVEEHAASEGFDSLGSADRYWQRSDQYNFARMGIPVMFLFADVHEDYHRPSDRPEKIDEDKIRRVARLVLRVIAELQDEALDL